MSYRLEFTLQGLPKLANGSYGHWRVRAAAAKAWKQRSFATAWPDRPPQPLKKAKVTLIRHSSSEPDFDGLVSSFKNVLDGLKQARVIEDDRGSVIGQPSYQWAKSAPKKGFVTVIVESIDQETQTDKEE